MSNADVLNLLPRCGQAVKDRIPKTIEPLVVLYDSETEYIACASQWDDVTMVRRLRLMADEIESGRTDSDIKRYEPGQEN
jgi:hypothetical protein